jgi:uncharacterized protein YukJ
MPVKPYGVLVGRALDRRREGAPDDTPHYQVHVQDDSGTSYRAAVNVQSQQSPSELLYLVDDDFRHPVTAQLDAMSTGWNELAAAPRTANLDFVRGNLFDRTQMRLLPADLEGPDNDLADLLDHYVTRAIADPAARAFIFGERWGPEGGESDHVFGFRPDNGVHNIHMNQDNSAAFRADDGVWQDGALLLHFPSRSRWIAVFLGFQSQAWHTDDETGHALASVEQPQPQAGHPVLEILAALVNPVGPAPESETVTVINASPDAVEVTGWRLADRLGRTCPLPAGSVPPGATVTVPTSDGMQLGNDGGTITLLDAQGLKVHGVAYTALDGRRPGWSVVF